jgi:hypothetical protein
MAPEHPLLGKNFVDTVSLSVKGGKNGTGTPGMVT